MELSTVRESRLFAQIEWHAEIESTNTRAISLAVAPNLRTPYLIGAERQTAGRGRGTNRWWSGEGALTFSLIVDPARDFSSAETPRFPSSDWPRLSLAAALALCETLDERAPRSQPRLKWPNDVYLVGRKAAGILLESPSPSRDGSRRLVLGMGVNVNNSLADAPHDLKESAAALIDVVGQACSRARLLCDWMRRFQAHARALAAGDPELANAWRAYCLLAGQTVSLQTGARTITGRCLGIDDQGALLVDTPSGTERCFGGVLVRVVRE